MSIEEIHAAAQEIAAEYTRDARNGPWMPREIAAQIAEGQACSIPDAFTATEDFMDAWVAACEQVASAIRNCPVVRHVTE
jgi:hypothetical protein